MEPFDGLEAAPGFMLHPMQLSLTIEVSVSFHDVDSKKQQMKRWSIKERHTKFSIKNKAELIEISVQITKEICYNGADHFN